jgi:AcrR family transcriptional regulator
LSEVTHSGAQRRMHRATPARRAEIVQAALDTFLCDGFQGASLRAIAARLGMTHKGLLHHFASKDELLVAVLDRRDEEERQWLEAQAAVGSLDGLVGLLVGLLHRHQETPGVIQLMVSTAADAAHPGHPAHEHFRARYASGRAFVATYLRAFQAAGELDAGADVELLAATLLGVMDGLQIQWLLDPDVDLTGAFARFFDGYRPRAPLPRR